MTGELVKFGAVMLVVMGGFVMSFYSLLKDTMTYGEVRRVGCNPNFKMKPFPIGVLKKKVIRTLLLQRCLCALRQIREETYFRLKRFSDDGGAH